MPTKFANLKSGDSFKIVAYCGRPYAETCRYMKVDNIGIDTGCGNNIDCVSEANGNLNWFYFSNHRDYEVEKIVDVAEKV